MDENRLLDELIRQSGYNKLVRPVKNLHDAVNVTLQLAVHKMTPFPHEEDALEVFFWPNLAWTDESLKWNPKDYGNITKLRVPAKKIWIPDIAIFNAEEPSLLNLVENQPVVFYSNGAVRFIPQMKHKVDCKLRRTEDDRIDRNQTCFMRWGSWTYHGFGINPQLNHTHLNKPDMSEYTPNHCWEVRDTYAIRQERFYDCCREPYPDLKFGFHFLHKC